MPLGELELTVMDVLWAHGPLTVRELSARLKGKRRRAYTTLMTTMDRLHTKGHLTREKEGLAWRYAPARTRSDWERATADDLALELLREHGEAGLTAFVEATAHDAALLDRLAELIAAQRAE